MALVTGLQCVTLYSPIATSVGSKQHNTETSLPKVIWEEGRVAAKVSHGAVKSPLATMARPKFAPKSTPSCGPIPKPHYLPHPWTRPTCDAKRHPDSIRRFSTMHWTVRRTDRQIVHGKV